MYLCLVLWEYGSAGASPSRDNDDPANQHHFALAILLLQNGNGELGFGY